MRRLSLRAPVARFVLPCAALAFVAGCSGSPDTHIPRTDAVPDAGPITPPPPPRDTDADDDGVDDALDCAPNDKAAWKRLPLRRDADGDGYAVGDATVTCVGAIPAGFTDTSRGEDCDDTAPARHTT